MTIPGEPFTDDDSDFGNDITPVDIRLINKVVETQSIVAEFGTGVQYPVPLFTSGGYVQQLLQRSAKRQRAIIRNALASTGPIVIANRPDIVQAGQGFILEPGVEREVRNQQPWYAAALSGVATASVLEERWEDAGE